MSCHVCLKQSIDYRKGLPRDLMSFSGTYADFEQQTRLALTADLSSSQVIAGDTESADDDDNIAAIAAANAIKRNKLRGDVTSLVARLCSYVTDEMISQTTDMLAQDFMQHRLPPPTDAIDLNEGRPEIELSPQTLIRLCNPR